MLGVDLVILAAGLGRRFGGDKQVCEVDDRGQLLMEYTLYDACLAGVERAVLVIREQDQSKFAPLCDRWKGKVKMEFAYQIPPAAYGFERETPLGTGHALLCAAGAVKGSFVLVNADDYYGKGAIALAVSHAKRGENALVGYPLGSTVPPVGRVSRGIVLQEEGYLKGIVECSTYRVGERIAVEDGKVKRYLPSFVPVSLNLFALSQGIFASAGRVFGGFLLEADEGAECLLTQVIADYLSRGGTIKVDSSPDRWMGMTHRRELEEVKRYLAALQNSGAYPLRLAEAV